MMRVIRVIKLIWHLLRSAIIRRSKHDLTFYHEDDEIWYSRLSFVHHNLAMVSGADKLCSYLANGKNAVKVEVIASKHSLSLQGYRTLTKTYSNLLYGADYDTSSCNDFNKSIWICPVTLFVLGRYPKVIYIRKV